MLSLGLLVFYYFLERVEFRQAQTYFLLSTLVSRKSLSNWKWESRFSLWHYLDRLIVDGCGKGSGHMVQQISLPGKPRKRNFGRGIRTVVIKRWTLDKPTLRPAQIGLGICRAWSERGV